MRHNKSDPNNSKLLKVVWSKLPLFILACIVILIIVLFSIISEKKQNLAEKQQNALGKAKPAVNVIALEMTPVKIRDIINLPGVIEPWTDLQLLSKIYGTVLSSPVKEGDFIKKGDVIASIDPIDYQIALIAAKSAYELASDDLRRTRTLFDKKLTSKAELDRLESTASIRKAEFDKAALQLSRCIIKAPIAGVIRELDVKPGLLLSVADPVARLLQIDKVKAVVGIPESDVNAVQKIDTISVKIQALDNLFIETKKHFLSSSPENDAMLYRLELTINNQDHTILPGMFVRANIIKKTITAGFSVPLYSVISRDKEQFVYIENEGKAMRKNVELGILEGWRIQVINGLESGDKVIVEGHRSLEKDQNINLVRTLTNLDNPF